jgi:hypothetical protein
MPHDTNYHTWSTALTLPYGEIGAANMKMGFLVDGTPLNQYEFEIVSFYEFASYNDLLVSGVTASHSDTNGMSAIVNFLASAWNSEPGQSLYNKGVNYAYNYLTGASAAVLDAISTSAPLMLTM